MRRVDWSWVSKGMIDPVLIYWKGYGTSADLDQFFRCAQNRHEK
jgi:hypothetical protein